MCPSESSAPPLPPPQPGKSHREELRCPLPVLRHQRRLPAQPAFPSQPSASFCSCNTLPPACLTFSPLGPMGPRTPGSPDSPGCPEVPGVPGSPGFPASPCKEWGSRRAEVTQRGLSGGLQALRALHWVWGWAESRKRAQGNQEKEKKKRALRRGGAHPCPPRLSHLLPLPSALPSLTLRRKHSRSLMPDAPPGLSLRQTRETQPKSLLSGTV